MHGSSKVKVTTLLSVFLLAIISSTYTYATGVRVKSIETALSAEEYLLSADIDFQLSKKAIEALNNGVSLLWTYQFIVKEQRDYVWDKILIEKHFRYRIQYHALLKMYRVINVNNGALENFSTLEAALDLLSTLRDYRLIEKSKLDGQKNYITGLKVSFEQDALPLPLRPMAYLNPAWYLSSDWYLWPLKK
jgi:Domain of unknown function (DUF4390)